MQRTGQFKMVLLGDRSVGKSSLALRFTRGQYRDHTPSTIGAAFFTHSIQIDDDTSLKIELWDTAGQERFHSLAPIYYRGASAGLVVYDVTYGESFRRAKLWVKELREANGREMVIGLVGNKLDLATDNQRQVDVHHAREYAAEHGLIFVETSARRGDNVAEIFLAVAKQVAEQHPANLLTSPQIVLPPNKTMSQKETISCCMSKA